MKIANIVIDPISYPRYCLVIGGDDASGKTKEKTMEKSTYWAIFNDKDIVSEGTFTECWKEFVQRYGQYTVADLDKHNIRIARKA